MTKTSRSIRRSRRSASESRKRLELICRSSIPMPKTMNSIIPISAFSLPSGARLKSYRHTLKVTACLPREGSQRACSETSISEALSDSSFASAIQCGMSISPESCWPLTKIRTLPLTISLRFRHISLRMRLISGVRTLSTGSGYLQPAREEISQEGSALSLMIMTTSG